MKYNYNKLVRDKIPEEINNMEGRNATFRIMEDEEYSKELNRKLLEGCHEFIEENDSEELADVMEVIEAIVELKDIQWDKVRKIQEEKRNKKGAFNEKIYLEYVEENKRNLREEKELNKSWRNKR